MAGFIIVNAYMDELEEVSPVTIAVDDIAFLYAGSREDTGYGNTLITLRSVGPNEPFAVEEEPEQIRRLIATACSICTVSKMKAEDLWTVVWEELGEAIPPIDDPPGVAHNAQFMVFFNEQDAKLAAKHQTAQWAGDLTGAAVPMRLVDYINALEVNQ